jgi:hypothetical protein
MPSYKVAWFKEQGIDLIVVPLDSGFARQTDQEQTQTATQLQLAANLAGLGGTVVPVWDAGAGRMGFRAPERWHPFFKSLTLGRVFANINREISW